MKASALLGLIAGEIAKSINRVIESANNFLMTLPHPER
jgi:hypothetical protein